MAVIVGRTRRSDPAGRGSCTWCDSSRRSRGSKPAGHAPAGVRCASCSAHRTARRAHRHQRLPRGRPGQASRVGALFRHRRWEVIVLHLIHPDEERLPDGLAYRFEGLENDGRMELSPTDIRTLYEHRFASAARRPCANWPGRGMRLPPRVDCDLVPPDAGRVPRGAGLIGNEGVRPEAVAMNFLHPWARHTARRRWRCRSSSTCSPARDPCDSRSRRSDSSSTPSSRPEHATGCATSSSSLLRVLAVGARLGVRPAAGGREDP